MTPFSPLPAATLVALLLAGVVTVSAQGMEAVKGRNLPQAGNVISCYECQSSIDSSGKETGNCFTVSANKTPKIYGRKGCSTLFHVRSGPGGVTVSIQRYGFDVGPYTSDTCTGSVCYCYSDSCNNVTYTPPVISNPISCYVCTSSDVFDNGCGATVNPKSPYVQTVSGCRLCAIQTITDINNVATYTRTCAPSVNAIVGCYQSTQYNGGQSSSCNCDSSFCNADDS